MIGADGREESLTLVEWDAGDVLIRERYRDRPREMNFMAVGLVGFGWIGRCLFGYKMYVCEDG
jgi:hypothetical protein